MAFNYGLLSVNCGLLFGMYLLVVLGKSAFQAVSKGPARGDAEGD